MGDLPMADGEDDMTARRWTPEEDEILRREFPDPHISVDVIARKLGRTAKVVWTRAYALGLRRQPTLTRRRFAQYTITVRTFCGDCRENPRWCGRNVRECIREADV